MANIPRLFFLINLPFTASKYAGRTRLDWTIFYAVA